MFEVGSTLQIELETIIYENVFFSSDFQKNKPIRETQIGIWMARLTAQ